MWSSRAPSRLAAAARGVCALMIFLAFASTPALAANSGPFRWPNSPPRGSPFPPSQRFSGVTFTGPYTTFATADTWYPSWGADGNLYSPYMDGLCEGSGSYGGTPNPFSDEGVAVIEGNDPLKLTVVCSMIQRDRTGWDGRYASASLSYNGVWYYGSYLLDSGPQPGGKTCTGTYCTLGPFVGFDMANADGPQAAVTAQASFTSAPESPSTPLFGETTAAGNRIKLGALHFADFGRNMQYSPDGYAYLVGHGGGGPQTDNTWVSGDNVYMVRVKPSPATINDPHAYEFYAGRGADGGAIWSHNLNDLRPLISWPGHLGSTTITYDAPLKEYLMWVTTPTAGNYDTGGTFDELLLEAPAIGGPYKLVQYFPKFGPQAYFLNVPSKFISADGRTMWLSYSANYASTAPANPPGSGYSWVLRQLTLDPGLAPSAGQSVPGANLPHALSACRRRSSAPRAYFTRRLRLTRHRIALSGRAGDHRCGRITRVRVSIARKLRDRRCVFLDSRHRFDVTRRCDQPLYLRVRGVTLWRFSVDARVAPGRYLVRVRARDAAGRVGRANSHRDRRLISVR